MSGAPAVLLINGLGTGGAEKAVILAAARLRQLGHDVRILCLERSARGEQEADACVEYLSGLSPSSSPLVKLLALPFLAFRLARYVARFGISVVMSHLFRANYVNVLARLLAASHHRTILVNHTRISRLPAEGPQGRINWALCQRLYPRADVIASVSAGAARECSQLLRLPEGKSITLYDPIDISAWAAATDKRKYSHSIVAMGRFVALKRFPDLIKAFASIAQDFPGLELRLIGDGPDRRLLENLAKALRIDDRTRFLGMLARPAETLAGCNVFVSTSETEGFGMAIVEALAAGVPVIASDCPYGPREILSSRTDPMDLLKQDSQIELAPFGLLYPVGNVKMLEKALRQVLSDEALREDLSRTGPRRAADFSIERSTSAYEKLLFA